MSDSLAGKVIVVTGGCSGIGAAVADAALAEGAHVILADLNAPEAPDDRENVIAIKTDVSDPQSVQAMVDAALARYGRIDGVVNSAGIGKEEPFLETTLETFDRTMAVNLRGTFLVSQSAARAMRTTGGGSIINIGSISGLFGSSNRAAYGTSKGGVHTLSKVMATDLAQFGIRVNVVAPGPIATPMSEKGLSEASRSDYLRLISMQRLGRPHEIADAAVFLLSEKASYITGQILAVDGGFSSQGLRATMADPDS